MSRVGGIILSFIGGLLSIFFYGMMLLVIYPEFQILGSLFVSIFKTIMIIGGIITIVGAFMSLFTNTPDSIRIAWKIILFGGIVGGGNILSILGAMQFRWYIKDIKNRRLKKKIKDRYDYDKIFFEIEGMVNYYLKQNEGDAYTAKSLVTKLEHNLEDVKKREYFRNNIENILNRMARRETIQQVQEGGEFYYSF